MPATYTLIASNTLSTSAASVTFSSIPGTYTDLVLRASIRSAGVGANMTITLNATGGTVYSFTNLRVNDSGVISSNRLSNTSVIDDDFGAIPSGYTSNTFSSVELYIPSYTVSQNKPLSIISHREQNATNAGLQATAGLWRNTNAITEIKIDSGGWNYVSGSSFFLYGIKNS